MNEAVEGLRRVLEEELGLYAHLCELAEQQREALVQRRTGEILEIATDEAKLLARAGRLNGETRKSLAVLGASLGCTSMVPSLSDVIRRLEPDAAEPLAGLRDRIAEIAVRLERSTQVNAALLESGLDAIRFTMRMLSETRREPAVCYGRGSSAVRQGALVVDSVG